MGCVCKPIKYFKINGRPMKTDVMQEQGEGKPRHQIQVSCTNALSSNMISKDMRE